MYRVLLVDDEILVRDAIRENINWNQLGYELVGDCANGKEAIEFVKSNSVDLVLTDICMPFVDGMELSEFLYHNFPEVVIVIFSGFGEFEYAKKAIQYKVAEYILKPVTALELSEVLSRQRENLDHIHYQEQKIEKLQKAYKNYRKNESLILAKSLCNLVMGTQDLESTLRELQDMDISLEQDCYRVAAVDLDVYSITHETSEENKQESALMAFVVQNISQEILERNGAGLAFLDANSRIFFLLGTKKPQDFLQKLSLICREIQEQIYETMKLTVSISVGKYVKNLQDLHYSYQQAVDGLELRYTQGDQMLFDCEKSLDLVDGVVTQDREIDQLCQEIKNNRPEAIQKVFASLELIYIKQFLRKEKVTIYLQQVVRAIYEMVAELNGVENKKSVDQVMSHVVNGKTCEDAVEVVMQYALTMGQELESTVSNTTQRQAMLALSYIRENYQNPDLNLNSICSYLNISTSYFSSIFKEATGETFMEVLIRIRMEKARELLEETTLKNYEIAERVGFMDPHYFSISFKKATGKTPTEYAKEKRSHGKK